MKTIQKFWEEKPLVLIIILAAIFRLIAVIFSKGYGMHDDHFLVIEAAQSWVDGADYNNWLPSPNRTNNPSGHSLLYPGLHFILFKFLQMTGLDNPQTKMYIVRFLHAAWSMLIVYFGYKIAFKKSGINAARTTGLLLAILFFMPIMSVRNLVEFVCIPPLLYATWLVIKYEKTEIAFPFLVAGLLLSLAFSIRFQTVLFIGGFGLAFLLLKKWKESLYVIIGFIIGLLIIQATTDILIWKKPFVELAEYIRYNIESSGDYPNSSWPVYLLLISGILIPPISIFLIIGFMRSWKSQLLLFLPTFIFFIFHSYFPNKQERFILPAIPFIIILGSIGWHYFMAQSKFWKKNFKLYRACWIIFFIFNTVPLLFVSVAYSHRSRVESMVYLSEKKDLNNVLIEESNRDNYTMPPRFYLKNWKTDFYVTTVFTVDSMAKRLSGTPPTFIPNYIVFNQPENISKRVDNMKKLFPEMVYETTVEPGFIDKVMHFLNKRNANFTCYIYKTGQKLESSK